MTTTDDDRDVRTDPSHPNALQRLYRGETSFDFVGRRRLWFAISAIVIIAGLISLGTRGLNLSIDFKGGTSWTVLAPGASVSEVTNAVKAAGVPDPTVETLGSGSHESVVVEADLTKEAQAVQAATKSRVTQVMQDIANRHPAPGGHQSVSIQDVGATWGAQITHKAVEALIIFFIVVLIYISIRFEWKMALAALIAVIHDILVTAGIYSITGLQVTPDTVVAILTILGYSLYDTVVVFDRVADNTKGLGASGRMTYEEVVNLSMNQTLARSINTSLVAIMPVASVLLIGAFLLGATTLEYFGFALVIGLLSGAYSSIFIASPILAIMKEREPRYRSLRQKLESRADRTGLLTPAQAALMNASATSSSSAARAAKRGAGAARPAQKSAAARARQSRPAPGKAPARAAAATGAEAEVLRPGGAKRARPSADVELDGAGDPDGNGALEEDEVEELSLNGGSSSQSARARTGGNATARPRKTTAQKRPPARRKGGKKGRRR